MFFKETMKYLGKGFWVTALAALAPALLISFFAKPFSSITFLSSLFVGQTDYYFTDIFMMMITPISNATFLGGIIGYIAFFLSFWLACVYGVCIIEKHLKTGELRLRINRHQFSSFLLPTLITLAIWAVVYLISTVAQSGLISLIHYICGQTPPTALDCFLSTLVSLIIFTAVLYLSVYILFLPLIMVHYGYGLRESFVQSLRLTSNNFRSLMLGFILPLFAVMGINFVFNLMTALLRRYGAIGETAEYWLNYVISVLIHVVIIVYLLAYDLIAFYKCSDFERRDILIHKWRG